MTGDDSSRDRKLMARMATFGVLCVVVAIVLLIVLDDDDDEPPAGGSPTGTVRQFLNVAAVEDNGDVACRYLTKTEKVRVERAARETASCSQGFNAGTLRLGGKAWGGDLKALAFVASVHGGRAVVAVSTGGSTLRFHLARATNGERNQFDAPATGWRIESGAAALVSR